jgi:biotin operon repressor
MTANSPSELLKHSDKVAGVLFCFVLAKDNSISSELMSEITGISRNWITRNIIPSMNKPFPVGFSMKIETLRNRGFKITDYGIFNKAQLKRDAMEFIQSREDGEALLERFKK